MDNAMYNAMYNIGNNRYSQEELNNEMSGNDANAIYYATHGGTGNANYVTGANKASKNPGAYVDFGQRGTLNNKTATNNAVQEVETEKQAQQQSNGFDLAAYLRELERQRQKQAQAAYDKAMELVADAYDKAAANYENIYESGKGVLEGSRNTSLKNLNDNASDAMREAYINKMLSMKNLSQQLAAQGISGGASESAVAGILNNYGNARNGIQKTWDTNRSNLEQSYGNNLANLYNAYQEQLGALTSNKAAQEIQLLNNLNNQIISSQNDYAKLIAANPQLITQAANTANANIQGLTPTTATVSNTYNPISTQQVNDVGKNLTNWWKYMQELDNAGNNAYTITQNLIDKGLSDKDIATLLNSYYV